MALLNLTNIFTTSHQRKQRYYLAVMIELF